MCTPARGSDGIRRILHCDMDCFYAAVHMRNDSALHGRPVVIGGSPTGRGVVAAASYEARRFGIRSAMPAAQAARRCPEAVFLRPEFALYRAESEAIFDIFRHYTPLVQPASLDEACLDVTHHLERHGSATAIARKIREQVRGERDLTVSVGVGPNRLVAKIASDFDKPDGLTVVKPHQVQSFLDPLPVRCLHGVGPVTESALGELQVTTIADLRAVAAETLSRRFGRHGQRLRDFAHGIDERPVRTDRTRRSLGHERTYETDLGNLEEMDAEVRHLSERVASGLAERGVRARTITLKVRYPDFTTLTRSRTLEMPTACATLIGATARDLLRLTDAATRRARLLGVTGSNLEHRATLSGQLELF